jgi:hypothetical protein
VLVVKAVDAAGNVDPVGTEYSWASVSDELSLCGDVSQDRRIGPEYAELYVVTCNVLIKEGSTLDVEPGSIIKVEQGRSVEVQGTLDANGTASEPVALTSWRDDSIGGDTNGDGSASGPAAGDWGGVYASPAGAGNPNPKVDLDHVELSYAQTGLSTQTTTTSITNSSVEHANGDGIDVNSPIGVPTVSGNSVDQAAGTAIDISNASLDMGVLNGNSGSGNGLNGVQLSNDTVTVSSSLPWSGNLVPVLSGGCSSLRVPPNVKLTLGAGTIVKGRLNCGGQLEVQGTLDANGTASEPVALTSWRDDSIGGDTNGDAAVPSAGDWNGITTNPAGGGNPNPTLDLDHVRIRYASTGVATTTTHTSITNSTVEHTNGDAVSVSSPLGVPTVANNVIKNSLGAAISIYNASVDLADLDGNSGTGNQINGVVLSLNTLATSSSLPWSGNLVPVLTGGCGSFKIPAGVTLTLNPGAVVKGRNLCGGGIEVEGTLDANGTAEDPVTFTSWRDDSVGGDTANDAGGPAVADWEGIRVNDGGSGTLDGTKVRYASTALSVSNEAQAEIHGAILDSGVGVSSQTFVDASEVDWGDPSGPSPIGTGTSIQGDGVFVMPWVGYVPPPRPAYSPGPPLEFNDCRKFFVVGVRGSGEGPQGDPPVYADNADGFGSRAYDAYFGFKNHLESFGYNDSDFKLLGLRYRALGVFFNPINFGTQAYFESIYEGVDHLIDALFEQRLDCPSQRAVLVGYSQGALVIHLALRHIAESNPPMLTSSYIAGVMLIADPAKIAHGSETVWEDENMEAAPDSGVANADGVWNHANLSGSSGGLPGTVTDRTISFCHDNDIVCAPGFGSSTSVHTGFYTPTPLNAMGKWMAQRVLGQN